MAIDRDPEYRYIDIELWIRITVKYKPSTYINHPVPTLDWSEDALEARYEIIYSLQTNFY